MKPTKKQLGFYLAWVTLNFLFLLIAGKLRYSTSEFYPFDGFGYTSDYDITDFLVYTVSPILILVSYNLIKGK